MVRHQLIFAFLVISFFIKGQDVHFTQWEAAEMNFNPAMAADFEGDWQFRSIYRNQWKSISDPFTTFSSSYTSKLYFLPQGWSVSGMVISDRSGDLIDMKNDQVHLGVTRSWTLGVHSVHLGAQGSYAIRGIDWSNASSPDQWNIEIGQFDSALPTSESNSNEQLNYFDAHAGVYWKRQGERLDVSAGMAFYHLTRPSDSFFSNDELRLPIRTTLNLGARMNLTEINYIGLDTRQMIHAKANELNIRGTYGHYLPNEKGVKELFGSVMHRNGVSRNGDAIMIGLGAATRTLRFFLAYDVNISRLEVATGNRGAIEFGIIFTSPSTFLEQITIPCDRY